MPTRREDNFTYLSRVHLNILIIVISPGTFVPFIIPDSKSLGALMVCVSEGEGEGSGVLPYLITITTTNKVDSNSTNNVRQ